MSGHYVNFSGHLHHFCLDVIRETVDIHNINGAQLSQTATAATQIALVDLLRSWSITPAVTLGHSSGE